MANMFVGIGINNYAGDDNDLAGCVNDANDWHAAFAPKCGHARALTDAEATTQNICDAIAAALGGLNGNDTGIISFSGHGSWQPDTSGDEPDRRDECLVPFDFQNGMITDDELRELLMRRNPASRVLLLTDSCHSGSVFKMFGKPIPGVPRIKFMPPAKFLATKFHAAAERMAVPRGGDNKPLPGVIHISGCRDHEFSYDTEFRGRPNGAFTYYALKAYREMKGKPKYLTWYELLRRYLPATPYPQTPVFNASATARQWWVPR